MDSLTDTQESQGVGDLDWGHAPQVNVSVKPTALYSQVKPADFEGSVEHILVRVRQIYEQVIEANGFLCIDMESYRYKDITLEVFRRLRSDSRFREYPHLGITLQVYLRGSDDDLDRLLAWSRQNRLPLSIRLVKGAYWDYGVIARQCGWDIPVYMHKAETDIAFERQAHKILENHQLCHLACQSAQHSIDCGRYGDGRAVGVPHDRYEF